MTDKEIIIDGVDVAGCKDLYYGVNCDNTGASCPDVQCKNNPNCYYKHLQRKEQEYKELQQYHNKCCEEHKKEIEEWLNKYNKVSRDFYSGMYCNKEHCNLLKTNEQENQRLQAENEELNDKLSTTGVIELYVTKNEAKQDADCYKQALEEVETLIKKDICIEECLYKWEKPCPDCDCRYNQIVYKINEVLKDE